MAVTTPALHTSREQPLQETVSRQGNCLGVGLATREVSFGSISGENCEPHGAASFGLSMLSGCATSANHLITGRIAQPLGYRRQAGIGLYFVDIRGRGTPSPVCRSRAIKQPTLITAHAAVSLPSIDIVGRPTSFALHSILRGLSRLDPPV